MKDKRHFDEDTFIGIKSIALATVAVTLFLLSRLIIITTGRVFNFSSLIIVDTSEGFSKIL